MSPTPTEPRWKKGLGGVDTCYARRGQGKVHYVRVYLPGGYAEGAELEAATYTLCGVRSGEPAALPLAGGECSRCFNAHPVWGRGQ